MSDDKKKSELNIPPPATTPGESAKGGNYGAGYSSSGESNKSFGSFVVPHAGYSSPDTFLQITQQSAAMQKAGDEAAKKKQDDKCVIN